MKTEKKATAAAAHNGMRFDQAAAELFNITRSAATAYIGSGALTLDGKTTKKNAIIKEGAELCFCEPDPVKPEAEPEDIPVKIVYEDDWLAVVDKPKGMVVHPAPGNYSGTLVSALLHQMQGRLSGINGVERPGIVHRIDKDTSGLLIIAKNDEAHIKLAKQIKDHSFKRIYEGIVVGRPKEDSGSIEKTVGRNPKDRKKMAVNVPGGREARTDYELIEAYRGFSLMKFTLHTGRTHQIRVHMSSIGHPLMGDTVYGAGNTAFEKNHAELLQGQCLHARYIGFTHPATGEFLEFDGGQPEYFAKIREFLSKID